MKMRFLVPAIILSLFLYLFGCSDSNTEPQDDYSVLLYEEDNGITLELDITEKIIIELPSNPSTGYHWEHANTDGTFINQDGESNFIEDEECAGLDGCGGVEQLSFIASHTGTGAILLEYHRSFGEEPLDQFRVDVVVTD